MGKKWTNAQTRLAHTTSLAKPLGMVEFFTIVIRGKQGAANSVSALPKGNHRPVETLTLKLLL